MSHNIVFDTLNTVNRLRSVNTAVGPDPASSSKVALFNLSLPPPQSGAEKVKLADLQQSFVSSFTQQAKDPEKYHQLLSQAYGSDYNRATAESIRQSALKGDFSWLPEIKVLSASEFERAHLNGQNPGAGEFLGAFDGQRILLNEKVLSNPQQAFRVFTEEAGHALDKRVNDGVDAQGDEGAIFSALILGERLSSQQRQALQQESDHGFMGQAAVEFSWFSGGVDSFTSGSGNNGADSLSSYNPPGMLSENVFSGNGPLLEYANNESNLLGFPSDYSQNDFPGEVAPTEFGTNNTFSGFPSNNNADLLSGSGTAGLVASNVSTAAVSPPPFTVAEKPAIPDYFSVNGPPIALTGLDKDSPRPPFSVVPANPADNYFLSRPGTDTAFSNWTRPTTSDALTSVSTAEVSPPPGAVVNQPSGIGERRIALTHNDLISPVTKSKLAQLTYAGGQAVLTFANRQLKASAIMQHFDIRTPAEKALAPESENLLFGLKAADFGETAPVFLDFLKTLNPGDGVELVEESYVGVEFTDKAPALTTYGVERIEVKAVRDDSGHLTYYVEHYPLSKSSAELVASGNIGSDHIAQLRGSAVASYYRGHQATYQYDSPEKAAAAAGQLYHRGSVPNNSTLVETTSLDAGIETLLTVSPRFGPVNIIGVTLLDQMDANTGTTIRYDEGRPVTISEFWQGHHKPGTKGYTQFPEKYILDSEVDSNRTEMIYSANPDGSRGELNSLVFTHSRNELATDVIPDPKDDRSELIVTVDVAKMDSAYSNVWNIATGVDDDRVIAAHLQGVFGFTDAESIMNGTSSTEFPLPRIGDVSSARSEVNAILSGTFAGKPEKMRAFLDERFGEDSYTIVLREASNSSETSLIENTPFSFMEIKVEKRTHLHKLNIKYSSLGVTINRNEGDVVTRF